MEAHPQVADLIAARPEAAEQITMALTRGIMLAGQKRKRPNKSETSALPLVTQGMVRGVVLTSILLLHYEWLESNGLGGTEKKSAKELMKLVREQYHFLRRKTAKVMGVQGDGTPEQNLSAYLQAATDLYWDIFEEADNADDARVMLAICQCYQEGLIKDSESGDIVSADTIK
jgi:hypothetical protein